MSLREPARPSYEQLTETAELILTQLGIVHEPSREPGVDLRRDSLVELLARRTQPNAGGGVRQPLSALGRNSDWVNLWRQRDGEWVSFVGRIAEDGAVEYQSGAERSIHNTVTHWSPLATLPDQSRVERLETAARAKAIEDCAKHFDERAKKLRDDIFATTTTRSEICRTVASELRDFARQALHGDRS